MEKVGKVISIKDNMARIEVVRVSACGEKCSSCKGGCSTTGVYIEAENHTNAQPGQFVKVDLKTSTVMKAAFVAYIFPLFMLVLGTISGTFLYPRFDITFSSELFSILLGFSAMILSYIIIKLIDRVYLKERIKYTITRVM